MLSEADRDRLQSHSPLRQVRVAASNISPGGRINAHDIIYTFFLFEEAERDATIDSSLDDAISQSLDTPSPANFKPTSKRFLATIPCIEVDAKMATNKVDCKVCHEEFEENHDAFVLPCKHLFHSECLFPWLKEHNTCPVCRYEMPREDPDADLDARKTPRSNTGQESNQPPHEVAGVFSGSPLLPGSVAGEEVSSRSGSRPVSPPLLAEVAEPASGPELDDSLSHIRRLDLAEAAAELAAAAAKAADEESNDAENVNQDQASRPASRASDVEESGEQLAGGLAAPSEPQDQESAGADSVHGAAATLVDDGNEDTNSVSSPTCEAATVLPHVEEVALVAQDAAVPSGADSEGVQVGGGAVETEVQANVAEAVVKQGSVEDLGTLPLVEECVAAAVVQKGENSDPVCCSDVPSVASPDSTLPSPLPRKVSLLGDQCAFGGALADSPEPAVHASGSVKVA